MSRIHGTRAIIGESISNAAIQAVAGEYLGITDDRLAQIVAAGKVEASAIVDGTSTIAFDGNLSFAGAFTTSGAFSTTLVQTADVSLTLPSSAGTLATEEYVNAFTQSLDIKNSSRAATQDVLPACTYNNGTAGVGATLTGDLAGALPVQDGITLVAGDRLLVKNQADQKQNGVYVVTAVGDVGTPFVLTRASDFDGSPANEVSGGAFTFVEQGANSGGHGFVVIFDGNIVIGTDNIPFTQFSGAGQLIGGNGISISGNTINIDATYWDDVQAINTLDLGTLVKTVGEGGVELDKADFEKLAAIEVSAVSINDIATLTVLSSVTIGSSGASLIGLEPITNLTATDAQAAFAELQGDIGSMDFTGANLIASETSITAALMALDSASGTLDESVGTLDFTGANYIAAETTVTGALMTLDSSLNTVVTNLAAVTVDGSGATLVGVEAVGNLAATNVQAALEELQGDIDLFGSHATGAGAALIALETDEYGSVIANLDATNVQAALAELQGDIDALVSGGGAVDYEYVGVGDNSTVLFTVAQGSYIAGSLKVYINGLLMKKGAGAEEVAETNAAAGTFTFGEAPKTNDEIIVTYRYMA
jgi:hypothetical protein